MFIVIENLKCTPNEDYIHADPDINSIINAGIMQIVSNIYQYNFYMFDEASVANNTGVLNGTQLYRAVDNPTTINWYARSNNLYFTNVYITDIYPISTLRCVIDNIFIWNNITLNGNVVVIDPETHEVYYYNIIDNKICKHNNKSNDLSKFYDLSVELFENRIPRDNEFIDILAKAFPQNNYIEFLETNGIQSFMKELIKYV